MSNFNISEKLLETVPSDVIFNSPTCNFYEGYFFAFQNMGEWIIKVGLAFFVFDLLASFTKQFIDKLIERYTRK